MKTKTSKKFLYLICLIFSRLPKKVNKNTSSVCAFLIKVISVKNYLQLTETWPKYCFKFLLKASFCWLDSIRIDVVCVYFRKIYQISQVIELRTNSRKIHTAKKPTRLMKRPNFSYFTLDGLFNDTTQTSLRYIFWWN